MPALLVVIAVGITLAAGVRSSWSPCGLSMLSAITPLAEQGRGHRYRSTATWYLVGAMVGGACLGGVMAGQAEVVHLLAPSRALTLALFLGASVIAIASDARLAGFRLPIHRRQVNERWLDHYRSWVYGAGFGWQIGAGLLTYIMTSAVCLMMVGAALVARPDLALALGVLFGTVRGITIFAGRGITTPDALLRFHARFIEQGTVVAAGTVLVMAMAAIGITWLLSAWGALVPAAACAALVRPMWNSVSTSGSCDVRGRVADRAKVNLGV